MKNMLPVVVVAFGTAVVPVLAADGASDASGEKDMEGKVDELTTMVNTLTRNVATLTTNVGTLTTNLSALDGKVGTLTTNLSTLTTNVSDFADRGHQVAVVGTVPIRLQVSDPTKAFHVDYYLVGHSTIPGFPSETVAATGKFASYSTSLPRGTYLFELQQPIVDQLSCHGTVSRLRGTGGGGARRGGCPGLYVKIGSASAGTLKKFNDGFGVYTVSAATTRFSLNHVFPAGVITESRPITAFKGAVKITKLK